MKKIICILIIIILSITNLVAQQNSAPRRVPGKIPNDPYFQNQVSFFHPGGKATIAINSFRDSKKEIQIEPGVSLDLPWAWTITTGSKKVIVAVLDDGFFYRHDDVYANIWNNGGESGLDAKGLNKASNQIDDDKNGYVDDVMGWDFVFDDPDPDHYIFDGMDRSRIQPYHHSIPALGIIGAQGNNGIGVAGINWNVSLMLLKIGAQGTKRGEIDEQRVDRVIKAIRYAADNGARIINWSGHVADLRPEKLEALKRAIEYAASKNVLLILAAGNDYRDLDEERNCVYPQCFSLNNILLVAEADFDGCLFSYETQGSVKGSNFGSKRVQIAAIGANFSPSLLDNLSIYGMSSGTSNAAPVVSGVAALALSIRPNFTVAQLKEVILKGATPFDCLTGKVTSGGVINGYRMLEYTLKY